MKVDRNGLSQIYECEGKLNFSIDEAKVDELLGEKAFCGGDLPEDVFLQLEEQVSGDGPVRYFWQDKDLADNFSKKAFLFRHDD